MLLQSRREDELGVGVVLDEPRRRKSLDRLVIVHLVHAASPLGLAVPGLHTAAPAPVGPGLAARVLLAKGVSCVEDGPVPRAPTQVAVERLLHLVCRGIGVVPQQRIQDHDNSGRTEAALASVGLGHPFLRGMGPLGVADALNGDDMLAVETYKRGQAGVDAGVVDLLRRGVELAYHDGACAASALATAAVFS